MIRKYCKFAISNPKLHKLHITVLLFITFYSTYELLENNKIIFALGFVIVIPSLVLLIKSAEYARKYFP
ncbi:hypothetical protein CXF93_00175 [Moritella sp. Urea-trap-13]|nr:hypothetical protein CXF93_00175 [Moritella sp. Urea-trap-13]